MAAGKQVFQFEVNGVDKATKEVQGFGAAINDATDEVEKFGDASEKAGDKIEEITALERAESIKRVTEGLAGGITTVAASLRGLGIESEVLNKLEQRANEFVAAVDGAVKVVAIFDKNNLKAFRAAIDGFKKSGIAARLFGTTTRTALTATGIGALVVAIGLIITNFDKLKEVAARNLDAIKKALLVIAPPIALIIEGVQRVSEKVGGLRQLFGAVAKSARQFFTDIGAGFAALVKGDFAALREVIKDFGKNSAQAFNEGIEEVNDKIAEEQARALTESTIKANKRRLQLIKARGESTFALEKQILQQELSLLTAGSDEALDKITEIEALKAAQRKQAAERRAELDRKEAEERAKQDAANLAAAEEKAAAELDLQERRNEALFELEQLRIQNQIDALESLDELTAEQIERRAELLADLRQNELDRALENEELTAEEILLLQEQFAADFIEIQRDKNNELNTLDEQRTADEAAQEQKRVEDKAAANAKIIEDEQKRAAAELEIQATLNAAAQTGLQLVADIAGKESALGRAALAAKKIAAVAEIGINLQRELAANAANAAANPANALTFGGAGISQLTASNILSVFRAAASTAAVLRFRRGGVVRGPSHEGGGVRGTGRFNNIEVEGGEFVVNKRATAKFLPQLRAINKFQDGGQLPNFDNINAAAETTQQQTADVLAAVRALAGREVVVSVEEINRVNGNLARVKETASI